MPDQTSLKALRLIFKGCAEDTRLRILNILQGTAVTVKDLCKVLNVSQPSISKHLSKLRLLRMVSDRRVGNLVYYNLNMALDALQGKIVSFIILQFSDIEVFKKDKEAIRKLRRK